METKISLHDLLSRLLPGSIFLMAFNALRASANLVSINWLTDPIQNLLAFGYMVGLILYALSGILEWILFKVAGGWPAERYLLEESSADHVDVLPALKTIRAFRFLEEPLSREMSDRAHSLALAATSDSSLKVQACHAQYAMHRVMATTLLALSFVAAYLHFTAPLSVWWSWTFAAGATVFLSATYKWNKTLCKIAFDTIIARQLIPDPKPMEKSN